MAAPDIERIVAPNPGPMTLEGTNTYLVGREPVVVIDPGPEDRGHIEAVRAAAEARGGIGAVLVTHSHSDHDGGVELLGVEPERPADGEEVAGLTALATPGHTEDHLCFQLDQTLFCGDLVLGEGSTIVPPASEGGSLSSYMASLRRVQGLELERMYPGHGPMIDDPAAKIAEYISHRDDAPTPPHRRAGPRRALAGGAAAGGLGRRARAAAAGRRVRDAGAPGKARAGRRPHAERADRLTPEGPTPR